LIYSYFKFCIYAIFSYDNFIFPETESIKWLDEKHRNLIKEYSIIFTRPDFIDDIDEWNNVVDYILYEWNATLDNIVKVVIYVKDIKEFPNITKIMNKYLENSKSVSTLVEISNTVKIRLWYWDWCYCCNLKIIQNAKIF